VQGWVGVKAFFATPWGRATLIVGGILALVAAFFYLTVLGAIPTLLLFGLAAPILLGQKRIRDLAIGGLVILLVAAPLASAVYTNQIRMPSSPADSPAVLPFGNGGSVLQNAQVNPFTGPADSPFRFTASVYPQYVPKGLGSPLWINLFVSTCPGATSNGSKACGAGTYPFFLGNQTLPANASTVQSIAFNETLPGNNIWWWQMAAVERNLTAPHNLTYIFLDPGNGYGTVQGPVTGDFLGTLGVVLPAIYLSIFIYVGVVFYIALLVYWFFKSREARRKQLELVRKDQFSGAALTSRASEMPPEKGATPAAPRREERSCPNCNAVVYENEPTCWKCGASLPPTSKSGAVSGPN